MTDVSDDAVGETLIDSKTAAKKLGCSLRHLDGMRLAGKVPHVRLGQLVRFSPTTLDRWIAKQMTEPVRPEAPQ